MLRATLFITDPSMLNEKRRTLQKEIMSFITNNDMVEFSKLKQDIEQSPDRSKYLIQLFKDDMNVLLEQEYGEFTRFIKYNITWQ